METTSLPIQTDRPPVEARLALVRRRGGAGPVTQARTAQPPRARAARQRLLGRATELARVAELLQECRFVSVVGPGGIGKTTLARALAQSCADLYPDGVRFLDLAVLAEGRELAGVLGTALGIERLTRAGLPELARCLRGQRLLIVFDCCEHHAAVTAEACEALLRAAPGIDVLCTSREPLLAHGERIVRLGPIGLPGPEEALHAATASTFPAVELFVAHASIEGGPAFVLDDSNVALVCEVCRAVEGAPLALELAASLLRSLGLRTLAQKTARWLLQPGADGAPADDRHRTLSSMLDWSYETLTPEEQGVFRRLAVFRGKFTLEAAGAVAGGEECDSGAVIEIVLQLASKSLVSMSAGDGGRHPRLLDLTREYAYAKLVGKDELNAVQRRHAGWLGSMMDALDRDWMTLARSAWLDLYRPWIDDLLAAIDWCVEPGGDTLLGAKLAGVGFSIGDQLGHSREFQQRAQRALEMVGKLASPPAAIVLRLMSVSGDGRDLSGHPGIRQVAGCEHVLQFARESKLPLLLGAPLVARWGAPYVRGDYPAALEGAERMAQAALAGGDPSLALIGQRTIAQSLHFLGRHGESRRFSELTLANSHRRIPLHYLPSPVDVGMSIRITMARMLWMEGAADQAVAMSEEALALSHSERPVAMCQVLAMASAPVALWRGETIRAAQLVRQLRERAERHGLEYWATWASHFVAALKVIEGRADPATQSFFDDTRDLSAKCRDHLVTFSPMLLTRDAIARCDAGMVAWCAPELLRAQALRCLSGDASDSAGAAAAQLRRALALAQEQGAPAWSLRSATSLADLYLRQGAPAQARATLEPVLARCSEGHGTADMRAALALAHSL